MDIFKVLTMIGGLCLFLFLASDLASYVTGAIISVDGAAQT